jgi:two-component system, chemotaxis family, protein-glutamate methylesterase/glutaminase
MGRLRVLVVEDSPTVRHHLCDVLGADEQIEIVAAAGDGKQAIELCEQHHPDVMTMDMMLPVMSGLAATEYIMAHCPTPILVVSSSFNRGELYKTYEALSAGAVEVLEKPRGDEPEGTWEKHFIDTVKLVARIRVITHLRGRLHAPGAREDVASVVASGRASCATSVVLPGVTAGSETIHRWIAYGEKVIAIGASTGGPRAIVEVLRGLPRDLPLPVLVVIHISEPFGHSFADWLDRQTSRRVSYAVDGQSIASVAGRVVMAPPEHHLSVRDGRLRLTDEAERWSCRPSVDVLFESVARELGPRTIACLLTGMGRDGAAGLLRIRQAGGFTIAQDEATSVVYGMPREAVELGAAMRVLPLADIGAALGAAAESSRPVNGTTAP